MGSQGKMRKSISRYRDGVLTDQEVHDHDCPGPFSFHSYLVALLNPNMWGDEQVLCLCSMLWQIGLTVVSAEEFSQIKFRHKSLAKADGVLVMCLGQHYIPAYKYSLFMPLDGYTMQPNGCSMHLDGYILPPDSYISTSSYRYILPPDGYIFCSFHLVPFIVFFSMSH